MEQKPAHPGAPAASAGPDEGVHEPPRGFWVWSNIACGVVLFIAIQWYLHNVYRYRPWIPTLTFDRAQIAIGMVYGWLAHPLLSAFNKGRLGAFLNPARFLDADTARFAGHKGVTVALTVASVLVFVAINLFPMLHLRYDADGSADAVPVVLVDGRPQRFHDNTIPVFDIGDESPDIVVTGNHNLYRVPLSPDDMGRVGVTTHRRVLLNRHFLYEDLHVELSDTSGAEIVRFTVPYSGEQDLEERCATLDEHAFHDHAGCAELLRTTLDAIGRNLMGRDTGVVSYKGRSYRYNYALDDGANVWIRVPPAVSELAQYPGSALDILGSADERESLLAGLRDDLDNMSNRAQGRMFAALFRTNGLDLHLRGTVAQQQLALAFARDVLSLGVEHVDDTVTADLIADIEGRSLGPRSPASVFVPAIETLAALSRDNRNLRLDVLARMNAFLRRLGTGYNSAKPALAHVFAHMLDDDIDTDIADDVLDGLAMIYDTARGVGPVVADISRIVAERRNELAREDLLIGLDGLEERDVPGDSEAPDGSGSPDEGVSV